MEHIINVTIRNKIATASKATYIDGNIDYVCGNSDFVVNFDFDAEWDEFNVKTARFIWGRHHQDMVFEGSVCPVPVMTNTERCFVGVFAGHLETTTPAYFPAKKSILCPDSTPADPPPDVYTQIMEKLNRALEGNGTVKSVNGIGPDADGDVQVNALPDDVEQLAMLIEADMLPAVYDSNGAILTDEKGNIILRY